MAPGKAGATCMCFDPTRPDGTRLAAAVCGGGSAAWNCGKCGKLCGCPAQAFGLKWPATLCSLVSSIQLWGLLTTADPRQCRCRLSGAPVG